MKRNSQTISLSIVAFNESAFIGPCIESARRFVDEIIVLDTGSKDGTQDIARRHGARLVCVEYPGNQAKAFNLLIDRSHCDWILVLDADEVLDPLEGHHILKLIQNPEISGFIFTIRNYKYDLDTKWRWADQQDPLTRGGRVYIPSRTVRLFRNNRGFRYSGYVHQNIYPSILKNGGKIENCAVPIHHYGHLRLARLTWKSPRFLEMQQKQIRKEQDNPRGIVELGVNYLAVGKIQQAIAAFEKAQNLGYGAGASFFMGKSYLLKGDSDTALKHLDEAILKHTEVTDIDFDLADAWELKGRAWRELEEIPKARQAYLKALSYQENHPIARNDLAVLMNLEGDSKGAEALLQDFLKKYPGFDVPWTTLGIAKLQTKKLDEAEKVFSTALDINPWNKLAKINLAFVYDLSGKKPKAKKAYAVAAEGLDRATAKALSLKSRSSQFRTKIPWQKRKLDSSPLVHIISHISGDRGQMLINTLKCLNSHPQIVLCGDGGFYTGLCLHDEITELGIDVRIVTTRAHLLRTLNRISPRLVLDHLPHGFFSEPRRRSSFIRIAVGHIMLPLPDGYDAYIVFSKKHARFQNHLHSDKIHIIPGCISLDSFKMRNKTNRADHRVTITMVSDLDAGIFPRQLLAYLPSLDKLGARILIAGRGARRHEIEPEILSKREDRSIQFIGPVAWRRIPEFLLNADIGLHLPETHEEAFSMSVLHMMAASLPVISKPWGHIPDLVIHGKTGYLAENEADVADSLKECILSSELCNSMGRAGKIQAAKYDIDKVGVLYRRLLEAFSAGRS